MSEREIRGWVGVVSLILGLAAPGWAQIAAQTDSPAVDTAPVQEAVVPHLIRFSGRLQNLAGKPVTGPAAVTFSLYTEEAGGNPLWFETQTVQADSLGNYSVLLGAMTPSGVPMELFTEGQARWLGVQVSNLPEQPRVLLVSVPYAMKAGDAETLGGKPASAFQLSSQAGSQTVAAAASGSLSGLIAAGGTNTTTRRTTTPQAITTGGTANFIAGWASDGSTLGTTTIFQDPTTNQIGIGTNTPAFPLDLNGSVFAIGPTGASPGSGGTMRFRDDTGTVRWSFGLPGSSGATDFFLYNNASGRAPFYVQGGANSYMLYLNANGNVGIGTTTPAAMLEVNGTAQFDQPVTFAGNQSLAGNLFIGTGAPLNLPLEVRTGTNEALSVASNGNVGIGTTTPAANLHVYGTGSTQAVIQGGNVGDVGLQILGDGNWKIGSNVGGVGTGKFTVWDMTSGTSRFVIDTLGNFGIGTPSPSYNLDLNGGAFALGPVASNPGAGATMRFRDDSGTVRWIFGLPGTVGSTDFFMYNNVNGRAPIYIQGNAPSYGLYLSSNGNIGVLTSNPTATLEVNGTAKFDGAVTLTQPIVGTVSTNNQLISTVATGTAPLSVASTTQVANLNASLLGGLSPGAFALVGAPNTFSGSQTISSGNLNLPNTGSAGSTGVITLGGTPFFHTCCLSSRFNTFAGSNSGNFTTTGDHNSGSGAWALYSITSGAYNTASGTNALYSNTTGTSNSAHGAHALEFNTTGNRNTAQGDYALFKNDVGNSDVALGVCALLNVNSTGSSPTTCSPTLGGASGNTAAGTYAGHTITTGSSNTFLGYQADAGSAALANATAIGANAVVTASNALVLGSINGMNGATASVKVGVGTSAPTTTLQVAGGDVSTTSAGSGLIVKSPDGTKCARIGIDNTGALVATSVTCP